MIHICDSDYDDIVISWHADVFKLFNNGLRSWVDYECYFIHGGLKNDQREVITLIILM